MVKQIIRDRFFLRQKSEEATEKDREIITDLRDTLAANEDRCIGMAANMIGERKRIIVFARGSMVVAMMNPKILSRFGEYETEEGCLSLEGTRKTKRYRSIRISWQDLRMQEHTGTLDGFQAQVVR